MKGRIPSITCVLVGIVFLFVSVRSILHHEYDYYNSVKHIWISYFVMAALGVWFLVYGLIGLCAVNEKIQSDLRRLPETMRTYRTVLLLILCCALPCITQAQAAHLTAAEAKNHVGETATVCGRVASAHFAEKAKGLPTFLNLDMPYPKQIFTILIWGKDKPKFGDAVRRFRYSKVCVSGEITSRHEIAEIVVTSPEQIQIQK